jgi:serine/threonine-protein kinase
VQIFDSGVTEEGLPFIVMELLRGEDLGHRIKRCGRLDLPEALHIVAQILRGLHRAHEAGIIHRDLKPDNIFLVDRDDDPSFAKILDFGISKVQRRDDAPTQTLTRQGTVLGTPFYMSPEQAQGLPDIDGRTDLWSVGAILYECLAGRSPHTGGSYEQVIVSICMNDVDDIRVHNPGVSEAVAQVIARALQRDCSQRFASAQAFLAALASASHGLVSQRSPGSSERGQPGWAVPPTPARPSPAAAMASFAPTLEAVGAAYQGEPIAGLRSRRGLAFGLAVVSLVLGVVGVYVLSSRRAAVAEPSQAAASPAPRQMALDVASAVPGSAEPVVVPIPPPEAPAPVSTVAPSGPPSKLGHKAGPAPRTSAPTATPPPTATAAPAMTEAPPAPLPAPPPPARPAPKGVAGGLEIKTE